MPSIRHIVTLLRRNAKPYVLSIPYYIDELRGIRTLSAFHDWVYFKFPFAFSFAPFPLYVTVEPTTICNFSCTHCWRLSSLEKRGVGSMPVEIFEKIIREASAAAKPPELLKIGGAGEPALHPHFRELMSSLDMLKKSGVKTYVYTNGTLFERFSSEEISRWNIDRIVVSVDGTDPDSYEKVRVGGNFHQLRKRVCEFREFRDQTSSKKPWIEIRHVILENETLRLLIDFRRDWLPPGDTVKFQRLMAVGKKASPVSIRVDRGTRRELPIEWTGNVPVSSGTYPIAGNIESQTIEELWLRFRDAVHTS